MPFTSAELMAVVASYDEAVGPLLLILAYGASGLPIPAVVLRAVCTVASPGAG